MKAARAFVFGVGVASVLAIAAACGSFSGSNTSGTENDASSDAGVRDGSSLTPDGSAVDAPSDGPPARFCDDKKDAQICTDFDDGMPLLGGFMTSVVLNGATIRIDDASATSLPYAFVADSTGVVPGPTVFGSLQRQVAPTPRTITCELDVKLEEFVDGGTRGGIVQISGEGKLGASDYDFNVYFRFGDGSTTQITSAWAGADAGGNDTVGLLAFDPSKWTRIRLGVDVADDCRGSAHAILVANDTPLTPDAVNGFPLVLGPPDASGCDNLERTLNIGLASSSGGFRIGYDNVVCTWQ